MSKNSDDEVNFEKFLDVFHDKPYNDILLVAEKRRERRRNQFQLWLEGKAPDFLTARQKYLS